SGISFFSQKSFRWMEKSRNSIAENLSLHSEESVSPDCLHFVSTGTEALYQMIYSFAEENDTAVSTRFEHPAFQSACEDRKLNMVYLKADKSGLVTKESLEETIHDLKRKNIRPAFISAIGVSNETGIIQDSEMISSIARANSIPFISDLIQAAGKIPVNTSLYDGFALNGIKFGAGPGAALVFIRSGFRTKSLFRGGSQENDKRAGTENILSMANFADAFQYQIDRIEEKNMRLNEYRNTIESFLEESCSAVIAGKNSPRTSNTTFAILPPCDMDVILIGLDQNGIILSTGSSCKSQARKPTASLVSMGYGEEESMRTVRISTGIFTKQEEVKEFIRIFSEGFERALAR
ncbi:MAG: aminotransferase class V-fold PLP-dependent enzyme, partial [Spirochaetia bacterium]|nr:aminotransferase class V-fold PLP-dependent enzyme [Spirochaetia bacterium]